jgi:hypothetical protein
MAQHINPRTITRLLITVATGIMTGAIAFPLLAGADAATAVNPTTEVRGADAAETEMIEWALGRFAQAGLELPATVITFHDDHAGCGGSSGLYRPGDPAEVHLCIPAERPVTARKLIALHELGHAWAETRTGEATRQAFLEERGLATWYDPSQQPHLWGAEHAAETISWALMDEPVRIIRIYDARPARLATAYQILTGHEPLNTVEA